MCPPSQAHPDGWACSMRLWYHHGGVLTLKEMGEAGTHVSDIDGGTNGTGMSVRNGVMPEVDMSFLSLPAVHAASAVLFPRLPSFLFWWGRRTCSVFASRKRLERHRMRYGLVEEVKHMSIDNSGERLKLHWRNHILSLGISSFVIL